MLLFLTCYRHAVACIYANREDPHDYVDKYLTLQYFVACYSPIIEPINGEDMWDKADGDAIDPPVYHKRPGRPTKKRKRGADEDTSKNMSAKDIRINTSVTCSNCGKYGHNRRSCKQPKNDAQPCTQESINITPLGSSQPQVEDN